MTDRAYIEDRIARYFHRGDFTDEDFDGAFLAATKDIGFTLRSQANETELDVLAVDFTDPFRLPETMREFRNVEFAGQGGPRSLVASTRANMNRFANQGDPAFYNLLNGFDLHVKPFKAKDFTIRFWAEPDEITNDPSSTNDVLTLYPQLYLYRVAFELALITQDVELAQGYDTLYASRVDRINLQTKNANAGNAPVIQGL